MTTGDCVEVIDMHAGKDVVGYRGVIMPWKGSSKLGGHEVMVVFFNPTYEVFRRPHYPRQRGWVTYKEYLKVVEPTDDELATLAKIKLIDWLPGYDDYFCKEA